METITSLHNPKVTVWRSLRDRKGRMETGSFLVEGRRSVEEAIRSGASILSLILQDDYTEPLPQLSAPVYRVPAHLMAHICDTKTPQGIAAQTAFPDFPFRGGKILALDGVQDPGNVGTILRTADAAGMDGLILSDSCADIYAPKVLRATMGSIFHLPCQRVASLPDRLSQLAASGIPVLASVLNGNPFFAVLNTLPDSFCLVIGNEGNGISQQVQDVCTHRLTLPMRGDAESLNAAVAAGIMMYALCSRNEWGGA